MAKNFSIDKNMAKLIFFQRTELLNNFQKKIRKIFGRYLFTNFLIKFFLNIKKIENIEMDTFSQRELFYSYRRSRLNREQDYGRCISVILMT